MIMTSVSGHLLNYEFDALHRNWKNCNPSELFTAPVTKQCNPDMLNIKVFFFLFKLKMDYLLFNFFFV